MILDEKLDNDIAKLDLQRLQRPRRVLNYYLVFSKIVMVATSTKTLTEIDSICFSSRLHKSICLDFQIMLVPIDSMIRSAKSGYECGLIDDMKDNPNLFHGHCRRSLKTKQGVSNVMDGSGRLTETEGEAAATLNTYYHLVFTRDDGSARFLSSAQ